MSVSKIVVWTATLSLVINSANAGWSIITPTNGTQIRKTANFDAMGDGLVQHYATVNFCTVKCGRVVPVGEDPDQWLCNQTERFESSGEWQVDTATTNHKLKLYDDPAETPVMTITMKVTD